MKLTTLFATLVALVALSPMAQADWVTINFEDTADWTGVTKDGGDYDDDSFGDPDSDGTINHYLRENKGVWFQSIDRAGKLVDLNNSDSPYLEAAGEDGTDGYGSASGDDSDQDNTFELGDFFLKTHDAYGDPDDDPGVRMWFADGTLANLVTGQIWDVDRDLESWDVQAYDGNGDAISGASDTVGPSGAYDAQAYVWSVSSGSTPISYVDITWAAGNDAAGMGFDNFAYTATPEPATMALWGVLGMSGFGYFGLRRRKK